MAAVDLIVREAGGMVSDLNGERLNFAKPFKGAIVSNGLVHSELIESVSE
jgi:fructose-1,6-bisphosphatase/inositol monophosphatase family enzyme